MTRARFGFPKRIASGRTAAAAAGVLLIAAFAVWLALSAGSPGPQTTASDAAKAASGAPGGNAFEPGLPDEGRFVVAAENARFRLLADPVTAHFRIENPSGGAVWRSYPDPAHWEAETITGTWRTNLLSPVMLEYIDASNAKSQTKLTNWMEEGGVLEGFEWIDGGFRTTFRFDRSGFAVPVEVRLLDDAVEATIFDDGITEGPYRLLNLKLYPLFGAAPSAGQDGYLLIPDGPGALIRFREDRAGSRNPVYRESVYGEDLAFWREETGRSRVIMPVFGIQSGDRGVLAVLTEGEMYAKIFAAPSGSLGVFNWSAAEWQFRIKFFQKTNQEGTEGFFTYGKERFGTGRRTVRYYLLEGEASGYPGMAAKYREYLMERYGLSRLEPRADAVPLFLDLIGGDVREGFLWDDYIRGTTTEEAAAIVERLHGLGIRNLTVTYAGWQRWGASSLGGMFPVDSRLGGDDGMRTFIEKARRLGARVLLEANYTLRTNRRGGYWSRSDGLRDMAGTVLTQRTGRNGEAASVAGPLYAVGDAKDDLKRYLSLGADGVLFAGGIGATPHTDYNTRHAATRAEVVAAEQKLLAETRDALGSAAVAEGSFYALAAARHLHRLADDYSYDLFADEAVPFAQIALHGIATYTSGYGNVRENGRTDFLRAIEYGAYPAYVFTAAPSGAFRDAYTVWYYSTHYRDWEEAAAAEYARWNEALAAVQDRFITDHRTLAPGVRMTVYEGGRKIIVNYNDAPYEADGIAVPALDFIVLDGEGNG